MVNIEETEPARPRSEPALRLGLPILGREAASWSGAEGQLISAGAVGCHEVEIRQPWHTLLMRHGGTSPGYEWSNGTERRKVAALRPGTILFAPAGRYAWIGKKAQSAASLLLLRIDPREFDALSDRGFDAARVEFEEKAELDDDPVRRTLFAIADEIRAPGPGGQLYRGLLVQQLLIQLARSSSNLAPERPPAYTKGGLSGWQLRRAVALLEADLAEPPTIKELAEHVGLSPTYFCTAFKQSTGVPPHRFLIERRVARAKALIAQGLSLTEIAHSAGFGSSSRLSVAFKTAVGVAPSVYRRSL